MTLLTDRPPVAGDRAFERVRTREFPALEQTSFLNAASFGPLPQRARRAMDEFAALRQNAHEFAGFDFAAPLGECRRAAARLIGARESEIALAPNTSHGLYLAARMLSQHSASTGRGGDAPRIVVSDREFPANMLPWLGLERQGAVVDVAPTDEDGLPSRDALFERLDRDDVALFALSAVQFASGYRADLEEFGRFCRERGILFVVDAIQAAGMVPLDVRAQHVDVLACGGQKWLCGPLGSGFVYVRDELCERLRPDLTGWLATQASADVTTLLDYDAALLDDARRFELGSLAVQDCIGLTHGIELILELGVERVWQRIRSLARPLLAWAEDHDNVEPLIAAGSARASGIVCMRLPEAARVQQALAEQGVVCALREGVLRFSPHYYNTHDEIARVVDLLARAV